MIVLVLQRAMDRGEVRRDIHVVAAVQFLGGLVSARAISGEPMPAPHEVDLLVEELLPQRRGQSLGVDLQPEPERSRRREARADAAVRGARDGLVETQRRAPELLVAEGLVPERLASLLEHLLGVLRYRVTRRVEGHARRSRVPEDGDSE